MGTFYREPGYTELIGNIRHYWPLDDAPTHTGTLGSIDQTTGSSGVFRGTGSTANELLAGSYLGEEGIAVNKLHSTSTRWGQNSSGTVAWPFVGSTNMASYPNMAVGWWQGNFDITAGAADSGNNIYARYASYGSLGLFEIRPQWNSSGIFTVFNYVTSNFLGTSRTVDVLATTSATPGQLASSMFIMLSQHLSGSDYTIKTWLGTGGTTYLVDSFTSASGQPLGGSESSNNANISFLTTNLGHPGGAVNRLSDISGAFMASNNGELSLSDVDAIYQAGKL
jgi:hypothetical protein